MRSRLAALARMRTANPPSTDSDHDALDAPYMVEIGDDPLAFLAFHGSEQGHTSCGHLGHLAEVLLPVLAHEASEQRDGHAPEAAAIGDDRWQGDERWT